MAATVDWDSRVGRRLRLRDLHVFFAVVQAGSMAKAASQLGVTQPSVSKAIGDLEAELGLRLFDRSAKGVVPNVYGNALIKCASAVFDELRQGIRSLEFLADPTQGELRIGCVAGITTMMFLPTVIAHFREQYPRILLHVDDVPSRAALLSAVRDRQYDLGIIRIPASLTVDHNDLSTEILFDDRMVIVAGRNNPLSRRRKVDLADLVDEPWIMSSSEPRYYEYLTEAFNARGLVMPKPSLVTLSVPLRAHLIANGPFVAPFAEAMLPLLNAEHQALKALPLDLPALPWPVVVVALQGRTMVPIAERFMDCARDAVAQLAKAGCNGFS
jgi:DNA-binding transcriptional LysR family regulator